MAACGAGGSSEGGGRRKLTRTGIRDATRVRVTDSTPKPKMGLVGQRPQLNGRQQCRPFDVDMPDVRARLYSTIRYVVSKDLLEDEEDRTKDVCTGCMYRSFAGPNLLPFIVRSKPPPPSIRMGVALGVVCPGRVPPECCRRTRGEAMDAGGCPPSSGTDCLYVRYSTLLRKHRGDPTTPM
jgi:hypothetical protein